MKLSLTSFDILNKTFTSSPRGYSPFEVDEYLDKILLDYRLIETNQLISKKELDEKEMKIKDLEEKVKSLEIENGKLSSKFKNIKDSDNVTSDNINLIQRINVLEKWIYNHGGNPKNIK